MATPVIRSVTATPTTLQPGQTATVIIDAFDPDARTVTVVAAVTDAGGHEAIAQTVLTVGDPLGYALTSADTGIVITPDPSVPGKFTVTV